MINIITFLKPLFLTIKFSDVILGLMGVLFGIIWGAYIFVSRKRKLIISHINDNYEKISEDKRETTANHIENIYKYHLKSRKKEIKVFFGLISIPKKVDYLSLNNTLLEINDDLPKSMLSEIKWLIETTAKDFYPDSKYPLYELTIDELIKLLYEIVDLTSNIINELGIPNLDKIKISAFIDIAHISSKIIKTYNYKVVNLSIKLLNAAIKIQSVATPIYWIKKGTKTVTTNSISQFIIKCVFELIAKETANIYSKSFMNQENV